MAVVYFLFSLVILVSFTFIKILKIYPHQFKCFYYLFWGSFQLWGGCGGFRVTSVMYGSAGLLVLYYLSFLGVYCCIYCLIILSALQYTMLIFGFPSLHTLRQNRRNDVTLKYKMFSFITTIFFYLYITINIIHKCTLNCKSFLVSSSSSNL